MRTVPEYGRAQGKAAYLEFLGVIVEGGVLFAELILVHQPLALSCSGPAGNTNIGCSIDSLQGGFAQSQQFGLPLICGYAGEADVSIRTSYKYKRQT